MSNMYNKIAVEESRPGGGQKLNQLLSPPLPSSRGLGNILNDLLAQCKEINDTLDVLRGKLEPIIAPVPATNVADGPAPFVPTNANELAVNVERDLRSIHRRLHELLDTVSL